MYKVNYYTLAYIKNSSSGEYDIGNIKQYNDVFYTECGISEIQSNLEISLTNRKGLYKYYPVITNIEKISGHLL